MDHDDSNQTDYDDSTSDDFENCDDDKGSYNASQLNKTLTDCLLQWNYFIHLNQNFMQHYTFTSAAYDLW